MLAGNAVLVAPTRKAPLMQSAEFERTYRERLKLEAGLSS
jgi:hypothetical protein